MNKARGRETSPDKNRIYLAFAVVNVFMIDIIIDLALIAVSMVAIVIIVKRWRGKRED